MPELSNLNLSMEQIDFLDKLRLFYYWELNRTAIRTVKANEDTSRQAALVAKLDLLNQLIGN